MDGRRGLSVRRGCRDSARQSPTNSPAPVDWHTQICSISHWYTTGYTQSRTVGSKARYTKTTALYVLPRPQAKLGFRRRESAVLDGEGNEGIKFKMRVLPSGLMRRVLATRHEGKWRNKLDCQDTTRLVGSMCCCCRLAYICCRGREQAWARLGCVCLAMKCPSIEFDQ